ncbi:MAG: aspartate/glutamate racemase family protein [Pseudomonadota bacterium]
MHIGLVGGIGPAATNFYHRQLIEASAARNVALELTIAHADSPILLRNQERGDKAAQAEIFLRLTHRLEAAGARAVAITAIAGHFCIDEFKARSPLAVIDMLQETNSAIHRMGARKIGIIGTR